MPTLGAPELILILVIVLVIFGAGKLPQIGGALGKSIREFRNAAETKDETPTTADTTPSEQKKSGL
jgi:sec-independent protein translocase protein TatA